MNIDETQRLKGFKYTLEHSINNCNQVFIAMHTNPDMDAIASAIGMYNIIKTKYKKPCYIIINESAEQLEAGTKKIMDKEKANVNFINLEKFDTLKSENDILIAVDTNKINRIYSDLPIDSFKYILIIDHHEEDEKTIKTDKKFITCNVSSTSEIIARLFSEFRISLNPSLSTYLLAGIRLDTDSFNKITDNSTVAIMEKLYKNGASNEVIQDLFEENYESDVRVNDLIKNLQFYAIRYAIACDTNEIYSKEELAKTADKALKYGLDASFAIGYIDYDRSLVAASGRSNGKINIGKIMSELGGGGNPTSGAMCKNGNVKEIEEVLTKKLANPYIL